MRQPHRGRNGSRHIGRLRTRAAEILSKNFPELDVRPWDISPATGRHRTDWRQDVYRWELFTRTKTGMPVVLGCWETLTEFVREAAKHGCQESYGEIWVGPKKKTGV